MGEATKKFLVPVEISDVRENGGEVKLTYYCIEDLCNVNKSIEDLIKDKSIFANNNEGTNNNNGGANNNNGGQNNNNGGPNNNNVGPNNSNGGPNQKSLEDQLETATVGLLDTLIELGEKAAVLKRLTQAINN